MVTCASSLLMLVRMPCRHAPKENGFVLPAQAVLGPPDAELRALAPPAPPSEDSNRCAILSHPDMDAFHALSLSGAQL